MSARSILTQAALAVAISHAFASIAIAQDASAQSLDRVIVTGTRSERGPDTLAARTVIEREDEACSAIARCCSARRSAWLRFKRRR